MCDRTAARVPGHVTGLFTVDRAATPAETGSRGAGLTLASGVEVRLRPAAETTVTLDGTVTTVESVTRVLEALGVDAAVEIETELPVGCGFGLSGGMALGTALAATEALGLARTERELVRTAHVADVRAGTGLGDVVAQARGGIVLRQEAGAPPHVTLDGIPGGSRVEYLSFGELSTPEVLEERSDAISEAGSRALERLAETPTRSEFMHASRQFTRDVGLGTPRVESILADAEAGGGVASMAMLGETVFALGNPLSEAGYDPAVTRVDPTGARLLE
ncbi:MAG: pantoate kinase [Halodesulfurarchaeum sp.]